MTKINGIIPPLVTPLADRDTLDREGLERLVEHVIEGGVSGVFVLGTTGEAPSLSHRLQREVVDQVCRRVNRRAPVFVGIADTAFVESVALARHAADAGADALVLTTPYYFPAGQTELSDYISHLAPELPLPLLLYNMPALTKVRFELDTLRELSHFEKIVGGKDSGGDLDYFADLIELRKERPDWGFYMGPEHLLMESVRLGGDGGVNGGANIFPGLFSAAYQAAKDNDVEEMRRLNATIDSLQRIYDIGKYASRHIKATKSALSILGICSDFMAEPFHKFKAPERARVESILREIEGLEDARS